MCRSATLSVFLLLVGLCFWVSPASAQGILDGAGVHPYDVGMDVSSAPNQFRSARPGWSGNNGRYNVRSAPSGAASAKTYTDMVRWATGAPEPPGEKSRYANYWNSAMASYRTRASYAARADGSPTYYSGAAYALGDDEDNPMSEVPDISPMIGIVLANMYGVFNQFWPAITAVLGVIMAAVVIKWLLTRSLG